MCFGFGVQQVTWSKASCKVSGAAPRGRHTNRTCVGGLRWGFRWRGDSESIDGTRASVGYTLDPTRPLTGTLNNTGSQG